MKNISNSTRKQAKRLFAKKPNTTRPFTHADYLALPSDPNRKPTK
jgi:hypothetical protein